MWIKFLYFYWFVLPSIFFLFYIGYKIQENHRQKKTADDFVIRSKYYLQVCFFTLFCGVVAVIVNKLIVIPLIPVVLPVPNALEVAQFILYPLLIAFLSPFAGRNNAPQTLQDKIKNLGLENPETRAELQKSRKKAQKQIRSYDK